MRFISFVKFGLVGMALCSLGAYAQNATIDTTTSEVTSSRPDVGKVPTPAEDGVITNSIKSQIAKSDTLSKFNIDVQTNKGVVTLTGTVDAESQASSLVELSEATIGVQDVVTDNLNVKDSQQPLTDMFITAKIKGLFLREKVFGDKDIAALNISVETQNGVVYLTGAIDNQDQLKNAMALIRSVKGVKSVEYNVKKVTPVPAETNSNSTSNSSPSTNGNSSSNGANY